MPTSSASAEARARPEEPTPHPDDVWLGLQALHVSLRAGTWASACASAPETAFALLALVLSVSLSALTFQLARRFLLNQRENLAVRQAVVNAGVVRSTLSDPSERRPRAPGLARRIFVVTSTVAAAQRQLVRGNRRGGPGQRPEPRCSRWSPRELPASNAFAAAGVPYVAVGVPSPRSTWCDDEFRSLLTELSRTLGHVGGGVGRGRRHPPRWSEPPRAGGRAAA